MFKTLIVAAILVALWLTAGARAGTVPRPDPYPGSTRPVTIEPYWLTIPAYTVDGRRLKGYAWKCWHPVNGRIKCWLVRKP